MYNVPNTHQVSFLYLSTFRVNVGDLTWPVLQTHLSGVVTVSEEEIVAAMKLVGEI